VWRWWARGSLAGIMCASCGSRSARSSWRCGYRCRARAARPPPAARASPITGTSAAESTRHRCRSTAAHAEIGCELMRAESTCWFEKPIASDLDSAPALIVRRAAQGRILQVGAPRSATIQRSWPWSKSSTAAVFRDSPAQSVQPAQPRCRHRARPHDHDLDIVAAPGREARIRRIRAVGIPSFPRRWTSATCDCNSAEGLRGPT